MAALAAAVEEALGHEALGEAARLALQKGGDGFLALLERDETTGRLVGYAQLSRVTSSWQLAVLLAPDAPDPTVARTGLLERGLAALGRAGGGRVSWWAPVAGPAEVEAARAAGLAEDRDLLQLRRPLPLDAGLDAAAAARPVRAFRVGADEAALLSCNNAAFAGHLEQGGWDLPVLLERESQDWFDPDGLLLAEDGDGLAGFCWTKVDDPAGNRGEIYVVGVDPSRQGGGLGRSLVAAGCRHLARRGCRVVSLYVDADNAPARRLYESLGFTLDHHDRAFSTEVAPGPAKAPAAR